MHTLTHENKYNTLIQRAKYPPLFHCSSVSYDSISKSLESLSLLDTGKHRIGRVVLFLAIPLMLSACAKDETPKAEFENRTQYDDDNWSWVDTGKYAPQCFAHGVSWEADTTIYF